MQSIEHLQLANGIVTGLTIGYPPILFFEDGGGGDDPMPIPGQPGAAGAAGAAGVAGQPGVTMILDGTPGEDGFPIPGPAGQNGANGTNGTNGSNGAQGVPGVALMLEGPPGEDGWGVPGQPGTNGTNGTNGLQGPPGVALMLEGEPGQDGWPMPGPAGAAGANGANGTNGTNGTNGQPGPPGIDGDSDEGGMVFPPGILQSVGLSMPSEFVVTVPTVTTIGTLTVGKAVQAANLVWASPNGSPGALSPRSLAMADLPSVIAAGPGEMSGRLTLTSGTPVTTSDVTGASAETIYWTPYNGDVVWVYNGTSWVSYTLASANVPITTSQTCTTGNASTTLTVANSTGLFRGMQISGTNIGSGRTIASITDLTHIVMSAASGASPGSATITFTAPASTAYDAFAVVIGGSLTLQLVPWTSTTARAQAISLLNGVYVNTSAINATEYNGIAATQGTYLGSLCTTGTAGQTEDSILNRLVWNYFNRCRRPLIVTTTSTWTYNSATYRSWNGSTSNRVTIMQGVAESDLHLDAAQRWTATSGGNATMAIGFCEDGTTANNSSMFAGCNAVLSAGEATAVAVINKIPAIGQHFYQLVEAQVAGGGTTTTANAGSVFSPGCAGFFEA